MSKYRAGELEEYAKNFDKSSRAFDVYMELARRLRQEEEDAKRDPVTDPRTGDRIECATSTAVWVGKAYPCTDGGLQWQASAIGHSATIIRRREAT